MAYTDPSSTLAGIRERYTHTRAPITGNSVTTLFASASDVPSLVAALEAALALHRRRDKPVRTHHICRKHAPWALDTGYNEDCPDCTITEKHVCDHCRRECPDDDAWPCLTYRVITTALTGTPQLSEDKSHDQPA